MRVCDICQSSNTVTEYQMPWLNKYNIECHGITIDKWYKLEPKLVELCDNCANSIAQILYFSTPDLLGKISRELERLM